jgi:hypothetical protein
VGKDSIHEITRSRTKKNFWVRIERRDDYEQRGSPEQVKRRAVRVSWRVVGRGDLRSALRMVYEISIGRNISNGKQTRHNRKA